MRSIHCVSAVSVSPDDIRYVCDILYVVFKKLISFILRVSPDDRADGCQGCFFVRELACTVRVEGCAVTYSDFSKVLIRFMA